MQNTIYGNSATKNYHTIDVNNTRQKNREVIRTSNGKIANICFQFQVKRLDTLRTISVAFFFRVIFLF